MRSRICSTRCRGGRAWQEDKVRAARAGFDRHFAKPVDINALRVFLAGVVRAAQ